MDIKPIETRYKGFHFRSRLEARWAVAMDALGVPWQYEAEGYDMGKWGRYLPDFFLPMHHYDYGSTGTYIEVKGAMPDNAYLAKICRFSALMKRHVHLVVGPPWDFKEYVAHAWASKNRITGYWVKPSDWKGFSMNEDDADHVASLLHNFLYQAPGKHLSGQQAINAARSARFEHGESGAR